MEIGQAAFTTTLNLLSSTIFSTDIAGFDSDSSQEFKKGVESVMEFAACPNVSDFFPVLTLLDLQGVRRKMDSLVIFLHKVFDEQIDRRTKNREEGSIHHNDFLDVLLDSQLGEGGPDNREHHKSIFSVTIRSYFLNIFFFSKLIVIYLGKHDNSDSVFT